MTEGWHNKYDTVSQGLFPTARTTHVCGAAYTSLIACISPPTEFPSLHAYLPTLNFLHCMHTPPHGISLIVF